MRKINCPVLFSIFTEFRFCFIAFIISLPLFSFSQTTSWAFSFGDVNINEAYGVCTDTDGFIYYTGTVDASYSFSRLANNACGDNDIYLMKVDADGHLIWAKKFGGVGFDAGYSVKVIDNKLFMAGMFSSNLQFDAFNLKPAGLKDAFVCVLDTAGNVMWVKKYGGTGNDYFASLAVNNNNVVIAGVFSDTLLVANDTLISKGDFDIITLKMNHLGTLNWANTFGSKALDEITTISLTDNGNIILAGNFNDSLFIGSDSLFPKGAGDCFVSCISPGNQVLWNQTIASQGSDFISGFTLDENNNIYLAGSMPDSVYVGNTLISGVNGGRDAQLIKLSPNGNLVSNFKYGGAATDGMNAIACSGGTINSIGNYTGTIIVGNKNYNSPFWGMLYLKTDTNLNLLASREIKGTSVKQAFAITIYNDDVILCGSFKDTILFDNYKLKSAGAANIFGAKLSFGPNEVPDVATRSATFTVYPNPTRGHITILGIENSTISVYNMQGKLVLSKENYSNEPLDLSGLLAGNYIYKVIPVLTGTNKIGKIVIE